MKCLSIMKWNNFLSILFLLEISRQAVSVTILKILSVHTTAVHRWNLNWSNQTDTLSTTMGSNTCWTTLNTFFYTTDKALYIESVYSLYQGTRRATIRKPEFQPESLVRVQLGTVYFDLWAYWTCTCAGPMVLSFHLNTNTIVSWQPTAEEKW